MTAEELIHDIDTCHGPCGDLCLSCPEAHYLKDIREVVVGLMDENKKLHQCITQLQKDLSMLDGLIFF